MKTVQSLVCSLWRTDGDTVAKIHIKNAVTTVAIAVTPTLYMDDGTALVLAPVEVPASGEITLQLNQALAQAPGRFAGHISTQGSARLDYLWDGGGHITASMNLKDIVHSLSFSQPFVIAGPATAMNMGTTSSGFGKWRAVNARYSLPRKSALLSQMEAGGESAMLLGLWWKHDAGVRGYFTMGNSTAMPITARYRLSGRLGTTLGWREIELGPHALQRFEIEHEAAGLPGNEIAGGGIEAQQLGPRAPGSSGGLTAAGWLENQAEGFSANIEFAMAHMAMGGAEDGGDSGIGNLTAGPTTITLAAAGLMLAKPMEADHFPATTRFAPYGFLRNSTGHSLDVAVNMNLGMGGMDGMGAMDTTRTIPTTPPLQLELAPGELRELPLMDLARRMAHDMGEDVDGMEGAMLNWSASFSGFGGDLLMTTGSTDQTGNYVFEVMPQRVKPSVGEQLPYWNTAGANDTMFSLWNAGTTAQDLILALTTADGSHTYNLPIHLAPGTSTMVDLVMLRAAGTPDQDGNLLPADATDGSASLRPANMPLPGPNGLIKMAKTGPPQMNVVLSFGIFNVETATCCTDCGACDFFSCPQVFVDAIAIGDSVAPVMTAEGSNSGEWDCSADASWDWDSGFYSSNGDGTFTGTGVGASDMTGTVFDVEVFDDRDPYCIEGCAVGAISALGGGVVAPTISGPNTVWWFGGASPTGYSTEITLTATPAGSCSWVLGTGAGDVNLSNASVCNPSITSSGTAFSHGVGDISITVTENGVSSAPFQITSREPHSLQPTSITDSSDSTFGYSSFIQYNIMDQLGVQLASSIPVNEAFPTGPINDYTGTNWRQGMAGSTASASPASFGDQIQGENIALPPVPVPNYVQGSAPGTPVQHWSQTWQIGSLTIGAGVEVQSDVLQKYINAARHTSIISPIN
ncbi:MAG TPA: hypothetical protein VN709_02235 [Terriglobales bacterium]|nr:hypothetical protein [Terriglobales bacterium]